MRNRASAAGPTQNAFTRKNCFLIVRTARRMRDCAEAESETVEKPPAMMMPPFHSPAGVNTIRVRINELIYGELKAPRRSDRPRRNCRGPVRHEERQATDVLIGVGQARGPAGRRRSSIV